jgi:hypothetical protein
MSVKILNQIHFLAPIGGQPFSVGCEVFEPPPYGMEGPHNVVVEYLGGTLRLSIATWLDLERQARMSLHLSFQQIRGKTLDQTLVEQREANDAARAARPRTPVSGLHLAGAIALAQASPRTVGFVHSTSDDVHKWSPSIEEVLWRNRARGKKGVWRRADWRTAEITSTRWRTVPLVDGEIPT